LLCLINRIAHEYLLSSLVLLWLECIWTESLTKFQCLRVLRLACNCCGIGLIFEARALPMVEELQLLFSPQNMLSLNGGFDFGIQIPSAQIFVE